VFESQRYRLQRPNPRWHSGASIDRLPQLTSRSNHDDQRVRVAPTSLEPSPNGSSANISPHRLWEETKRKTLGREVPVAVLAAGWYREHGRPLRIAVDTPLSLFELKTATIAADKTGGMNHITRTFMYQVLHLLSAGVQPIFVFDGSQKPTEKGTAHPAAVKLCPHVAGLAEHGLSSASRRRIDVSSLRTEDDLKCER